MTDLPDPNKLPDPDDKQAVSKPSEHPTRTEAVDASKLPPYRTADAAQRPSTKLPVWVIPVLIAMLVIGVLVGRYWGSDKPVDTAVSPTGSASVSDGDTALPAAAAVLTVETVQPSQDSIGNTLKADGTISAKDIATVSAKVSGVAIEQIRVEEGERVKAGQILAVFDTDAAEQQVLQASADVAEAEATLANAKADAARVLPLIDIDAISRQEADRYRTAALRAQAALQAAKARLSNQKLSLSNAKVIAPVSGIISEKMVEVGQVAGSAPLFTIIKNGALEWQADIDPKLIGDVRVGTPVKVSLPQGQSVMGEVRRIAPTADDNRQITVYASLANNSNGRAGMYQTGEFLLGSIEMQMVPNSAIVSNDGYDYVMLVTDIRQTRDEQTLGRIQRQRVSLGMRSGSNVTLIEPLPMEAHVVKQGGSFLNEGDTVRIVSIADADAQNPEKMAGQDPLKASL